MWAFHDGIHHLITSSTLGVHVTACGRKDLHPQKDELHPEERACATCAEAHAQRLADGVVYLQPVGPVWRFTNETHLQRLAEPVLATESDQKTE